ncbi:hypothetical protein EDB85DRAFT_200587 [Lactarius pseudohatsudake]|nr:hypothetical protein EDB85DRAFT_200587 [Lactarius pseudohatsudake]
MNLTPVSKMAKTVVSARLDVASFSFAAPVVLITHFGRQIVQRTIPKMHTCHPTNAMSNAPAILVRIVAAVVILTFMWMSKYRKRIAHRTRNRSVT